MECGLFDGITPIIAGLDTIRTPVPQVGSRTYWLGRFRSHWCVGRGTSTKYPQQGANTSIRYLLQLVCFRCYLFM
jgi:hypothetical protein